LILEVQREQFATGAPLVATHDGALAFVPPALPPRLDLPAPTVAELDRASHAVGELAGVARLVGNPRLLVAPYVRREAVLSSRIEGTRSTLADVYAAEAGQDRLFETSDVGEVVNYVRALEHGLDSPLPLSTRLILELHRILMTGVRGADPVVPMREALDLFERFMHDTAQPPLVHAATASSAR
jgi:Fic family protein